MTHPLRKYRRDNNLTAEGFGALVNLSKFSISRIENGLQMPPVSRLRAIEMATGGVVTVAKLIKAQARILSAAA